MNLSEMLNIGVMQGFAGLSLFAVLLLMGLGLAIIFGQMGVINMAHGEFMTIGAYTIFLGSQLTSQHAPSWLPYYFPFAIVAAFGFAFVGGWLVEWALIRHLYRRPLDTLLATWGISLAMQQCFRTFIGPKEVSPTLPEWLLGSWAPTPGLDIPINGLFVVALTTVVTVGVLIALGKSRWGLRVRATVSNRVMANAIGIDTMKTDRLTFAIGCGIAGMAGAAFTTIGSTGPTSGQLYIVDSFLVVTFGGAASLLGTVVSAFGIAQTQSITEFFMAGSMAKVLTLSLIVLILMVRPQVSSPAKFVVDTLVLEELPMKALIQRYQLASVLVLALLLAVVLPLTLDIFRLNLIGKYLTYAFVAVGLVMVWGYGGVLSLGQGVFFGLGGYAMAMFLKLEASDPVTTKIQSTPGIPDFMDWNQITELPLLWVPFKSLPFALFAVVAVPTLLAWIVSFAMFKRRVGGVYFAIITQAVALIVTVLIIGQQGYTGGVNGMTDLKTVLGWDTRTDHAKYVLYYLCVALLLGSILLCRWIQTGKAGTLLLAMRDKEDRVRFSGYDVANFRIFTFCLAAALSGIGGALFSLQVGFMSPSFVGIVPSVEMVIFAAVGGRMSLVGAVYGTLLVNAGKTFFSESFPDLWLFLMAALFIGVTMAFPMGLAGLWESHVVPWWNRRRGTAPVPDAATRLARIDPAPEATKLPPGITGQQA